MLNVTTELTTEKQNLSLAFGYSFFLLEVNDKFSFMKIIDPPLKSIMLSHYQEKLIVCTLSS